MLAAIGLASFIVIMVMTMLRGAKVTTTEEAIKGTEAPPLPLKVEYGRTWVALIPSSVFIIIVLIITLLVFGYLWGLPVQFQVR